MDDLSASQADAAAMKLAGFQGDLAQFARVVDLQGAQLAWLLGAGASAMSDIPTAGALILRFKQEIYCSDHSLDVQEVDPSDRRTRRLIEDYFDGKHGLPSLGDPDEYSIAFEKAYPSADVRTDVIADLCRRRRPNFGHVVLAALMAADRLRVAFTTNFDELIETGAHSLFEAATLDPRPSIVLADLGGQDKAARALQKDSWPLVAKLHGDFREVRLKNTVNELAAQDAGMRDVLRSACRRFGLVVAGYSGRDESVMTVLNECLQETGTYPAGIYWCFRPTDPPAETVLEFLAAARSAGRTAVAVPVDNFIELASAIERAVRLPEPVRKCVASRRPPATVTRTPLPSAATDPFPILRLNALPITRLPTEVRRLDEPSSRRELAEMQRAVRGARARGLVARRSRGSLVAVGHDGELRAALAPLGITVTPEVEPLDWSTPDTDPADLGLLLDAVTIGIGRTTGLRHVLARRGHQVRVHDPRATGLDRLRSACKSLTGTVPGTTRTWAEAVGLTVEQRDGAWWLLVVPELWVRPAHRVLDEPYPARLHAEQVAIADFVRERWAPRYNRNMHAILDAWVRVLCGGRGPREVRTWNLPANEGVDPTFEIVGRTAYSRPYSAEPPVPKGTA